MGSKKVNSISVRSNEAEIIRSHLPDIFTTPNIKSTKVKEMLKQTNSMVKLSQ